MRRIEFTQQIDDCIISSFKQGLNQNEIRSKLNELFGFNVGQDRLSKRFKELGLNGNTKKQKAVLLPWHKVFTNTEFPNKITNCILYDMCWNWKLDDIAKEHKTTKDILLTYFNPKDFTKELRNRYNSYYKLYFSKANSFDYCNYNDEEKTYIVDEVNKKLNGKSKISCNYKENICLHDYKFDFYCEDIDVRFIGPAGVLYTNLGSMNTVGFKVIQLLNYTVEDGHTKPLDTIDIINQIVDNICRSLDGEDIFNKKSGERIELSHEMIDNFEDKVLVKVTGSNSIEELMMNELVKNFG